MKNKKNCLGLYIHIPFCKSKCFYCDFNSFAGMNEVMPAYFDALKKEISLYGEKLKDYSINTVFIGGGTPSVADAHYICDVMNAGRQCFNFERNPEISIETNPGTLSYEKLAAYKALGINRLSIGLQAWQNEMLKKIGRIHRVEEFIENFNQARKIGFKNINVDLIFGLPGQTISEWVETLKNIVGLVPEHLSCYSLKVEEDTVFGRAKELGELKVIEDELDREMYYKAIEVLENSGYGHYEISNFSKPGFECRHNLVYWKAYEYIGLGAGAHSYLQAKRFNNVYGVNDYISLVNKEGIHIENIQEISKNEKISEAIILGLRLIEGISISEFRYRFNDNIFSSYGNQIDRLVKKGLIQVHEDRINLTPLGLDLANEVFVEFI